MVSPLNPATLTAILGPTNTGKTHYAVERMLGRQSGVIGLPLRLLAREVYDRIVAKKGAALFLRRVIRFLQFRVHEVRGR